MKKHQKPILISLIVSAIHLTGTLQAAPVTAPAAGDLFLGFRSSGGTGGGKAYIVNIGNDSAFRNASAGTTLNLGSIGADLTSTFGANWQTRGDLFWGIFGTRNQTNPVTYSSRAQSPLGTPSPGFAAQSLVARSSTNTQLISVITAYSTLEATTNNAKAAVQTNSATSASYNYQVATEGTTDFGSLSGWSNIEGSFGGGTGGTALDLFRYSGNTTTGIDSATRLGALYINNTGALSFLAGPLTYNVSVTTPSNGSVSGLTGGGTYSFGSQATLTATPNGGYAFTGWTVNSSPAGNSNPLVLTVDGNKTVAATFVPIYNVTVAPPLQRNRNRTGGWRELCKQYGGQPYRSACGGLCPCFLDCERHSGG